MQREFYVSCIRINGIPLLPPLMSDSVKEEMKRYRSLAVKVEETLKARQFVERTVKDQSMRADTIESINKADEASKYCSDSDLSSCNTRSDTDNSDSRSKITIVGHASTMEVTGEAKDKHDRSSTSSAQCSETGSNLTNDTINDSESVTARTAPGRCVNATEVTTSSEDTTPLENLKLEVPKTLDIVPIMLSNFECREDNAHSILSEESKDLPKLSRQGSYVLDTPSPMLLAHMCTELANENYVPTSTIVDAPQQKKQWNIVQPKVEWENERLAAEDIKASNKFVESTMQKSNVQHTESKVLTEPYQTNESIDSSGITISEEHTCKSDLAPTEYSPMSNTEFKNADLSERSRRDDSRRTSNTTKELQEYAEDAGSSEARAFRADGSKRHDKIDITKEYQDLFIKTKSLITSDKLLTVYKKIEEIHKRQMMELIDRQQREQLLLQAEFQRQQMLLLGEIQKCSSKIPYQVNPSDVTADRLASCDEPRIEDEAHISGARHQLDVDSSVDSHAKIYRSNKSPSANYTNVIVCPLDNISPTKLHLLKSYKSPLFTRNNSSVALNELVTKRINLCDAINNNGDNDSNNNNNNNNDNDDDSNDCESHDRTRRKNSTVNRQLFPLASNTMHIPVLDTSIYQNKHVRAVNIINAYTRGYLVRRLMQTERVITLKKIYKEALQCMLKLHVDAPLNLAEVNFLHRLQLQCDAASMNLVELFAQSPARRMKVIAQDREIRQSRTERPTSARSYSFATQKTLARKNLKEFESSTTKYQRPLIRKNPIRSRCQTWTSDIRERLVSPNTLNQSIRRSTSTGTVRKPWR